MGRKKKRFYTRPLYIHLLNILCAPPRKHTRSETHHNRLCVTRARAQESTYHDRSYRIHKPDFLLRNIHIHTHYKNRSGRRIRREKKRARREKAAAAIPMFENRFRLLFTLVTRAAICACHHHHVAVVVCLSLFAYRYIPILSEHTPCHRLFRNADVTTHTRRRSIKLTSLAVVSLL